MEEVRLRVSTFQRLSLLSLCYDVLSLLQRSWPKTQERKIEQTWQLHSASIYNVPVTTIHNIPQAKAKKQLVLYTNLRLRDGWVGGDWCKSNKARPNKEENRGKPRNITNITINKTKIRQLETNENNRINMNQCESMINRKSLTSVSSGRLFTLDPSPEPWAHRFSRTPCQACLRRNRNWELGIIGNSLGIGCNYELLGDTAQQEWCVCNRLDWFQEIPSLEAQSFRKKGKDCARWKVDAMHNTSQKTY